MGAGGGQLGLPATITSGAVDGTAAREADDVVEAVGPAVADAAAIAARLPDVFPCSQREDVLGRAGVETVLDPDPLLPAAKTTKYS